MKHVFTLMLLLATTLVACTQTDTPEGPVEDVQRFHLTSEGIITISAEGGELEIAYVIDNPVAGAELTATSTTTWITDITVAESVCFNVDANSYTESRVGSITLSYAEQSITVGIQQDGYIPGEDDEVRLIVTSDRKMSFDAKGGNDTITYTLEGAEEGAVVEASSNKEWINISDVNTEKVTFSVDKNSVASTRKGIISLNYQSCRVDVTISQEAAQLTPVLSAQKTVIEAGSQVEFIVTVADEDVTAEATIYEYYTKQEVSNPYTIDVEGEHIFYAKHDNNESKILTITVIPQGSPELPEDSDPDNYTFKYRMLLIDHTGTDCGYCPYMMESLKTLSENSEYNDYYNIAMAHSYNSSDPAYSPVAKSLFYYYNRTLNVLTGYPTLTFNYCYEDSANYTLNNIYYHFNNLKKESQDAAIAVATKIQENDVVVNVALKSA
ncbi:MAG: BACON domain-containing protein, partial [Alistipes sp.]|nr:BACON domain-containing protein [Alistipes sp.]